MKPSVEDLESALQLEPANPTVEGWSAYRLKLENENNGIFLEIQQTPEIFEFSLDKDEISYDIGLAKFAGINVPDDLEEKLRRDGRGVNGNIMSLVVAGESQMVQGAVNGTPKISVDDDYLIRADAELYELDKNFPRLVDLTSLFKQPFGIAKFTKGAPTYIVDFEAKVFASQKTLDYMFKLAGYFAKAFNGIVYDSDNDKFELPKSKELYEQNMAFFIAVAKDANSKGADVKPFGF
jgi:hypothetical protein